MQLQNTPSAALEHFSAAPEPPSAAPEHPQCSARAPPVQPWSASVQPRPECSPRAPPVQHQSTQCSPRAPKCSPRAHQCSGGAPFTDIYTALGSPGRATKPDPNTNRIYNEAAEHRSPIFTRVWDHPAGPRTQIQTLIGYTMRRQSTVYRYLHGSRAAWMDLGCPGGGNLGMAGNAREGPGMAGNGGE